jgi:hypothetical protein
MTQPVLPSGDAASRKIAKVARARKLAVHLPWMCRAGRDYEQWNRFGSRAGELGARRDVQKVIGAGQVNDRDADL